MEEKLPFLISIPHGGTDVPEIVRPVLALAPDEIRFHADPSTREIFGFRDRVSAFIDTPVSRMVVDLNRPPLPLPPKDPDGIIKVLTVDGKPVYRPGSVPDIRLSHRLLMTYYFPYHQEIDDLFDRNRVRIAFDCHSMLPEGAVSQKDAGRKRPLFCLGNNGNRAGLANPGGLATCPPGWIAGLARRFEEEFRVPGQVAINDPFSGGFIANAHYWHKGVPWIQIEVNRAIYDETSRAGTAADVPFFAVSELREKIWKVLAGFGQEIGSGEE
ncbi:MAG TPA: N-formylglutamate amidohydrolase [Methanoregula sp.]|nr:N-formylglutamate amidohydrolase [Methanoregula sp.]